ncbi:hypothetical protein [Dyadobacter sp. NIV53]|uniref:hypothetical protein n=1 Tax=Dyadobacter sp. NIV53 TaxID=2861765 RepID=UPI001C87C640|nr:hypothetical protein [Dyadobacter sp. NIV53]
MQTNETLLCPSYFAKSGAELFGVVNKEGRVEYLDESIKVDQTFVDAAQRYEDETGRAADERFRFAGKCIKGGCHQWSLESASCSLVGRIIEAMNKKAESNTQFSHCAIRKHCRWFAQQGSLACANCTETVRSMERSRLEALDPDES